jgi:pimeloyl-ACP methyl ester carboxylesterase
MTKLIKIILIFFVASIATKCSISKNKITTVETQQLDAIKIETIGEGKPILYLPGFSVSGSIWEETIANLNLKRKSYLFSYAGFNGIKPIEMPWYATIKNSIIEFIRVNNMTDIIIIGHSMGGSLAVDIASELPNRVSEIVIIEALPSLRELMMPNVPAESLYYDNPYNRQMLDMDESQFKNTALMMASNMTFNIEKIDTLTNWILEADRKTWVYGYTDLLKLDLRDVLRKVKSETLIIGASFPDVQIAKEHYEYQYSNLVNKTIVMASNSKHFVMFDQPKWFYKTVNDFLVNEKK